MAEDKPKIIVDDDWKQQAQAEKEKLSEEVEQEGGAGGPRELPPANFATLIGSMVTQIYMALGGYQDPKTKQRYVDLDVAKHYIDTMSMIEEKTKGNLTEEEKKMLDQAIYESRIQYVQIAQRVGGGGV